MKIFWITFLAILVALLLTAGVLYLIQRLRQKRAEDKGIVVYASVLSVQPLKGRFTKQLDMREINLLIQDPGALTARQVKMRTRIPPGQKIIAGHRLMVAIDPSNPQRVYPVGPEAAKRVVLTGSRQERRLMEKKGFRR